MKFRPCIDIHNGRVKQIVGATLTDSGAEENFVSKKPAEYFAELYKSRGLSGGHVILLNKSGTREYEADKKAAEAALSAYPGELQIGGGVTDKNAKELLNRGASHVIVTSFILSGGEINYKNLQTLKAAVGKERIVLDLSCKKCGGEYYIVTDRWQKKSNVKLKDAISRLAGECDEFLIHAASVEGKGSGIDEGALALAARSEIPVTYAGGIASFEDIEIIRQRGGGKVDFTVGSALDIFGGNLSFDKLSRLYA